MKDNFIFKTDSYKYSHAAQYPEGTEYVYSYVEPRGGEFDKVVVLGVKRYVQMLANVIITKEMVDEAERLVTAHGLPFYREGWDYIVSAYGGRLPVRIKALPEGSVVPVKNIVASIENTDSRCWWLTSFLETAFLRAIWYPSTVCTLSWSIKDILLKFHEKTSDLDKSVVSFKLQDFGARGTSSGESAAIGGMAHIVNFLGSDTFEGIIEAMSVYGFTAMPAFSIPAAEHSTMTSLGKAGEILQFKRMIDLYGKPGKLFAVVSDGYNIWEACDKWGTELKEAIIKSGATLVVRPDSGCQLTVPVQVIERLMTHFGYKVNSKGYKVLPDCVRVIQGDGITIHSIPKILENLETAKLSLDNLAFGMGGGLLQQVNRDTMKWAMKATAMKINGQWVDVFKDPVTDPGKQSKKGKLKLIRTESGEYRTVRQEEPGQDLLVVYYENSKCYWNDTWDKVQERADSAH